MTDISAKAFDFSNFATLQVEYLRVATWWNKLDYRSGISIQILAQKCCWNWLINKIRMFKQRHSISFRPTKRTPSPINLVLSTLKHLYNLWLPRRFQRRNLQEAKKWLCEKSRFGWKCGILSKGADLLHILTVDVRILLLSYYCTKCKDTILQDVLVINIDVSAVFSQKYGLCIFWQIIIRS